MPKPSHSRSSSNEPALGSSGGSGSTGAPPLSGARREVGGSEGALQRDTIRSASLSGEEASVGPNRSWRPLVTETATSRECTIDWDAQWLRVNGGCPTCNNPCWHAMAAQEDSDRHAAERQEWRAAITRGDVSQDAGEAATGPALATDYLDGYTCTRCCSPCERVDGVWSCLCNEAEEGWPLKRNTCRPVRTVHFRDLLVSDEEDMRDFRIRRGTSRTHRNKRARRGGAARDSGAQPSSANQQASSPAPQQSRSGQSSRNRQLRATKAHIAGGLLNLLSLKIQTRTRSDIVHVHMHTYQHMDT